VDYLFLNIVTPRKRAPRKSTKKKKNNTLAIAEAPDAMPVKPNMGCNDCNYKKCGRPS
jgi:hypothetical protein